MVKYLRNKFPEPYYFIRKYCRQAVVAFSFPLLFCPSFLSAQQTSMLTPTALKRLSLEELLNLEVTSVSKTPQKLAEVASAIQVVTGEDIRRSGATRLPEALRLAPNLQVAQYNSHDWGITARGLNGIPLSNNTLANKLLVMTDGRSIYTPLFGGVFWDVQNVVLEDIDRIEVVSGPGGTLWGANAVNGVINIITKNTKETQGLYATGIVGTFLRDHAAVRYGGRAGSKITYRVYGQFFDQKSTRILDTLDAQDSWLMMQGGFRMDYEATEKDLITVQGDLYWGKENTLATTTVNGQNILGRWTHRFSDSSDLKLQFYYDRTWRDLTYNGFRDELSTYDLDIQHRFTIGRHQEILYGAGVRVMVDSVQASASVSINPSKLVFPLYSGFLQDRITLVRNWLELTVGAKISHNYYSKFEIQPSARIAFTPKHHTVWAAVSRAVRVPSRFDADLMTSSLTSNRNFGSEQVIAYELGYRVRPFERMSISLAGFFNQYLNLRSLNTNPAQVPLLIFRNSHEARTWGAEVAVNYVVLKQWRLRAGYTYLGKRFRTLNGTVIPGADLFEGIDPSHQAMLQSILDLPHGIQLDAVARYVDSIPLAPPLFVKKYVSLDVRLAWAFRKFEFSVVGQNLLTTRHQEFGLYQIPRSIYGRITCRLY